MRPRETATREPVVVPMKPTPLRHLPEPASDAALDWLEGERHIPRELALKLGVVSGERWVRQAGGPVPVLGFAYTNEGHAYAVKWRTYPGKAWTQDGSAQTLYLAEHVEPGGDLVITEGEIDALSWHLAGIPAVSIPSGGIGEETRDDGAKLRWMSHHDELLAKAQRIFLAVDTDQVGETTAQELARRLGKHRCWRIGYPEGCKDTNAVLVKHGVASVMGLLDTAKPWPVPGVKTVADLSERVLSLYERGLPKGLSTGWSNVDDLFSVSPGNVTVLTGVPGHGKSTWLDNLLMNMMIRHETRVAYASFENPPDIHISKLLALWRLTPFGEGRTQRLSRDEVMEGMAFLNERASFVEMDEVPTPKGLFDRFDACIRRQGARVCVIDPFNFINLGNGEDITGAINTFLAQVKIFAMSREVAVFIVAHPAKPPSGTKDDWVPTGYSIAGSAHWYNRADFGLTVHRGEGNAVALHVWKARFAHQGKKGVARLVYDPVTAAYEEARDMPPTLRHFQGAPF